MKISDLSRAGSFLIGFIASFCTFSSLVFSQEEGFCQAERFKRAHVGFCIMDVETGEVVGAYQADQFFVPASLQKIPLSVAALSILGEDFRFKTQLEYEGAISKDGVLQGNICIRGGGDPTLALDVVSFWEGEAKKHGIQKIDGKVCVDSSCFETSLASPYWYFEDLGNYYGAGASGLTINDNAYRITFQPGREEGDPATVIATDPPISDLIFYNEVKTGAAGSGDRVYVFGTEYSPVQYYRGTVPIDQPTLTVKAAIPDPARFCASSFCSRIPATQGIEMARVTSGISTTLLSRIESPPVKEIVKKMNLHSVNLYAEHLLKAIGAGKAKQGAIAIEQFLEKLGVFAQVRDGSGLARTNLISPRGFTTLLCKIRKSKIMQSVYDSFPEPGKKGSLRYFQPITGADLRAKTGSMSNICNLGGYITLPSGKEYAFSLFCNNYEGANSEIQSEMHRYLNDFVKKQAL